MFHPIIAFPIHDSEGQLFLHLWKIVPILIENFSKCFVSITPVTLQRQKSEISKLEKDTFFDITINDEDSLIGDHFLNLYRKVVNTCSSDTIAHLVTEDRLIYILETEFKETALKDFQKANSQNLPVLFQRSKKAWSTHPKNYLAAESMVTQVGQVLFGKKLDFCWNQLVLQVGNLKEILPKIESHDFTAYAEIVFHLKDKIKTVNVDWLSWEDPFILGKDAFQLKQDREKSREETDKRLSYVNPIIKMLFTKYFLQNNIVLPGE